MVAQTGQSAARKGFPAYAVDTKGSLHAQWKTVCVSALFHCPGFLYSHEPTGKWIVLLKILSYSHLISANRSVSCRLLLEDRRPRKKRCQCTQQSRQLLDPLCWREIAAGLWRITHPTHPGPHHWLQVVPFLKQQSESMKWPLPTVVFHTVWPFCSAALGMTKRSQDWQLVDLLKKVKW